MNEVIPNDGLVTIYFPSNRSWAYANQWCQQRGVRFYKEVYKKTHTVTINLPPIIKLDTNKPRINYPRRKSNMGGLVMIAAMLSMDGGRR